MSCSKQLEFNFKKGLEYCIELGNLPNNPSEIARVLEEMNEKTEYDSVNKPLHYQLWEGTEVIHAISSILSPQEFVGYCKGNILKYRMRGLYKNGEEDKKKAEKYQEFLSNYLETYDVEGR